MTLKHRFRDRAAAGEKLAPLVLEATSPPSVVLGIPHGGVAVARPIAARLRAPLTAAWVRKLVSPHEPDVVVGAVDIDGDVTLGIENARAEGLGEDDIVELAYHAHERLLATWERAEGLDAAPLLPGATAIIVDDGMNTGLTMRAAMRWARRQQARRVVIVVPVADARLWPHLAHDADRALTLELRDDGPIARSDLYDAYRRPTDADVSRLLGASVGVDRRARGETRALGPGARGRLER